MSPSKEIITSLILVQLFTLYSMDTIQQLPLPVLTQSLDGSMIATLHKPNIITVKDKTFSPKNYYYAETRQPIRYINFIDKELLMGVTKNTIFLLDVTIMKSIAEIIKKKEITFAIPSLTLPLIYFSTTSSKPTSYEWRYLSKKVIKHPFATTTLFAV